VLDFLRIIVNRYSYDVIYFSVEIKSSYVSLGEIGASRSRVSIELDFKLVVNDILDKNMVTS